nr:MAG TPA: hypothetical protein [Caudoviricetes sp.]
MNKNEENKVGSVIYCIREKFKASILFHNPPFGYESGLDILPLSV